MTRLVFSLFVCALPSLAQSSSLQGVVTDNQGALIPQAAVSITNLDTSATRMSLTDGTGAYVFAQVPPGKYKFEAQVPGFRTHTQQVQLQINTPATVNVTLELGQVSETVNVVGDAVAINTQNATIGNPFTETQIRQLPLQTRNVVELLSLQPGVTPEGQVLGAKRDQNNVTLDGVDINDSQSSTGFNAALPVPLDSVQEFRTTVAGQGADQGRSSGGQVSLVTKSGSNSFHGSVYEFHRNVKTAANDWFNNRSGVPRENLIRNQYGASFGGRMIKDRAFFFVNWEDRKDRSASAQSRTVPTETFKQGIVQMRLSNGQIAQLAPAQVRQVDPMNLGSSQFMLDYLKQYPAGNDPQSSADRGLNFSIFRFNAPLRRDDRAYVAKMDFNLDKSARHTLSLRGTLADNARDQVLEQFPGQGAAALNLDNSKGLSARYTSVLSSNVVNVFNYGYTRLGIAQSGADGAAVTFFTAAPTSFTRGSSRFIPTTNLVNDTTWTKARHTYQFGLNFRFIQNDRSSFATSYPSYSFSRNTLRGLGADLTDSVTAYVRQQFNDPALRLTEATQVTNAFGTLLGVLNQFSATYNFGRDGQAQPFGQAISRSFATSEYEFYMQDTFKVRRDLTVVYGLRYSSYQVPYEKNGVQVLTRTPIETFFAERVGGSQLGIPGNALPNAALTFDLAGPINGGRGWFERDNNNFAPRLSLAYAPESDTLLGRLFGKGAVLRAGGAMLYDRYGSDMVVTFDQSGSPGLATSIAQPRNTNFSDSFRYAGGGLPTLPAAPAGGFPFTPPTIIGGFNSLSGVSSDLVAPYSMLLNASYARPLPLGLTVEVGYVGRLTRKGLLQQDYAQPLTRFRDPKSGLTWTEASGLLRDQFESGVTPAQVRANPSILPNVAFFENMFPGSATANYFYTVYGTYAASDLDALNDMDRERLPNGSCIVVTGCNTFFALQQAGLRSWVNASNASFHGGTLVVRRPVSRGWGFDLNYTLSHSMDISSREESGAGTGGAVIQDSFDPRAARASSDFDVRHNITANAVGELPFGRSRAFFSTIPGWVDHFIGGWQLSGLMRYRSGFPLSISNGGVYPTNYLSSALAIMKPGAALPANGNGYNQLGNPSLFRETSAVGSFIGQYPGTVGTRGIVRGTGLINFDLSLGKFFNLPFEGHRIQLRGEAFNAFNNVNFSSPNLSLANPGNFGQFSAVAPACVMQFALRYEF